jgi:muramoyltetrapeptide carboxypeptidase
MIHIPPYLKKGDTIGIVAPAGFMAFDKMQSCLTILEEWGYNVQLGATTQSQSENYFSGTDEERMNDLQLMLDDPNINAILCARGGYGVSRIVDELDYKYFRKHPKWVIGFSDITVLHAHIFSQLSIASMHAPMAAAFNDGEFTNPYIGSLQKAISGEKANYECSSHPLNRKGKVKGTLVGGNLSLLAHLVGSPSDFNTKNKILFIEDIGEYLYNVDRMMLQLKRSGKFDRLGGLIVGGFTDMKDTERPFGKQVYDIIASHLQDLKFPVCFGFPVSHGKENYALKVGQRYQLNVSDPGVVLKELD